MMVIIMVMMMMMLKMKEILTVIIGVESSFENVTGEFEGN